MKKIYLRRQQLEQLIKAMYKFELAKNGIKRSGYVIVKHAVNSTDNSHIWKDYWEENHPSHHFPEEAHICPSCLIKRDNFVGGHVTCDSGEYIIPVCSVCNKKYKYTKANDHLFYVKESDMVRAPEN